MELMPRQENLQLVFRLFSLMHGLPIIFKTNIHKTERPFNAKIVVQAITVYFHLVSTC